MNFDLFDHTVLLTRAGSRVYGMHNPDSDLDIKGVAIPPLEFITGTMVFEQADKQEHFKDDRFMGLLTEEELFIVSQTKLEGSIYEYRKFIKLAADANPNILDVLFCRDEDILHITGPGVLLRLARDAFISKKIKHTFSGYAAAQLKRIKLHKQYIMNPPTHKPARDEYDLPNHTLIPADQLAAAEALVKKQLDSWEFNLSAIESEADRIDVMGQYQKSLTELLASNFADRDEETAKFRGAVRAVGLDKNLLHVMERERQYKGAMNAWHSYEEWKRKRNPARAELEAKYGYDTKHGAHLVRLLRMCRETLETGKVNVWRHDAEELKAIRRGLWTYEEMVEFAEREDAALTQIMKSPACKLPHGPDLKKIQKLADDMFWATY